ncbi:hypothetical protein JTB14_028071 [Gonioctena quinquepunctata]|nr:hypothetical protein JTB14_028071 [Gonioctena quinquepunctata]
MRLHATMEKGFSLKEGEENTNGPYCASMDRSLEEGKDNTSGPYCASADKDGSLEVGIDTNGPYCASADKNGSLEVGIDTNGPYCASADKDGSLEVGIDTNGPYCASEAKEGSLEKGIDTNGPYCASADKDGSLVVGIDTNGPYCASEDKEGSLEKGIDTNGPYCASMDKAGSHEMLVYINGLDYASDDEEGLLEKGIDTNGSLEKGIDANGPYYNELVPERLQALPPAPPITNGTSHSRRSVLRLFDPFCPESPEVEPKREEEPTEEAQGSFAGSEGKLLDFPEFDNKESELVSIVSSELNDTDLFVECNETITLSDLEDIPIIDQNKEETNHILSVTGLITYESNPSTLDPTFNRTRFRSTCFWNLGSFAGSEGKLLDFPEFDNKESELVSIVSSELNDTDLFVECNETITLSDLEEDIPIIDQNKEETNHILSVTGLITYESHPSTLDPTFNRTSSDNGLITTASELIDALPAQGNDTEKVDTSSSANLNQTFDSKTESALPANLNQSFDSNTESAPPANLNQSFDSNTESASPEYLNQAKADKASPINLNQTKIERASSVNLNRTLDSTTDISTVNWNQTKVDAVSSVNLFQIKAGTAHLESALPEYLNQAKADKASPINLNRTKIDRASSVNLNRTLDSTTDISTVNWNQTQVDAVSSVNLFQIKAGTASSASLNKTIDSNSNAAPTANLNQSFDSNTESASPEYLNQAKADKASPINLNQTKIDRASSVNLNRTLNSTTDTSTVDWNQTKVDAVSSVNLFQIKAGTASPVSLNLTASSASLNKTIDSNSNAAPTENLNRTVISQETVSHADSLQLSSGSQINESNQIPETSSTEPGSIESWVKCTRIAFIGTASPVSLNLTAPTENLNHTVISQETVSHADSLQLSSGSQINESNQIPETSEHSPNPSSTEPADTEVDEVYSSPPEYQEEPSLHKGCVLESEPKILEELPQVQKSEVDSSSVLSESIVPVPKSEPDQKKDKAAEETEIDSAREAAISSVSDTETKAIMADLSEKLEQQQQEISELKLQLNASQQARATLELELTQKEEIILKTQAEVMKIEQGHKQDMKHLKEELNENSRLIEKDGVKELEESLKEAKAREAKALSDLSQRIKDEMSYQKTMEQYERMLNECSADLKKHHEDYEIMKKHFRNLELAFSDVHTKYEKTKESVEYYVANEKDLLTSLADAKTIISKHEERYESLKSYAKNQIDKSNKDILGMREKSDSEINKLRAIIKRMEIKCGSLEVALQQKTEESEQLAALCDEVTGKKL